ncbi:MAG TPA: hypothetical protein VF817_01605 [Patescibacteria group bacterium]
MKLKTINELNNKVWYRFLKVIYIGSFLFILLIASVLLYSNYRMPDKYISQDKLVSLFINAPSGVTFDGIVKELNTKGYTVQYVTDPQLLNNLGEAVKASYPSYSNMGNEDLAQKVVDKDSYLLSTKDYSSSWFHIVFGIVTDAIVFYVAFEILKRAFYYIVLGKVFPKKSNEGNSLS